MICKNCGEAMEVEWIPEPSEDAQNSYKEIYICRCCEHKKKQGE